MTNCVEIRSSKIHGLGVFAMRDIKQGELISESHIIPLSQDLYLPEELATLLYPWGEEEFGLCISGVGCLFNHSAHANARYYRAENGQCIQRFEALRNISKDEEITIFYHQAFEDYTQNLTKDEY